MNLDPFRDSPHYQRIFAQIENLGLVDHIGELEQQGYTVIPPERVAPPEFHERLRRAILQVHERRTSQKIDPEALGAAKLDRDSPSVSHWTLLAEDPVFQETLMNPVVTAMAKYLCGNSVVLSDMVCLLKQKDERPTHNLHADQHGTPPPLPLYAQLANVTWALTDYNESSGPLAIVPGSHKFGRYPNADEADFLRDDAPVKPIQVHAAAGSLIVWHGATWHASFPRKSPGLRLNLIQVFTRVYMKQIRDFRSTTPKEILDRHPVEFARLLGINSAYPFDEGKGPNMEDIQYLKAAGENPWA